MIHRLDGADIAAELSDEGGAPVVQLHGLTSSRARDRVLQLDLGVGLSGTRLLRYDARGHGLSTGRPVAEDYRWPSLAEDLLALLDIHFPGERVHGVGPSMGAATLLHALLLDPDRFSGLTLVVPPTAWETRPAKAEVYRQAADLIEGGGFDEYLAASALTPQPPTLADAPSTRPEVPLPLLPAVLRGAAGSDLPDPARLEGHAIPTRILAWVDDPSHPLATAQRLHALLPESRLTVARTPTDLVSWPQILAEEVARHGVWPAGSSPA
ncbi:alpha/beta hydrolase [Brevibacterium casei]|uniref:Alpha/beta hydrolase n=1 Tax=Brevibacterium casei TaxID=33889 RepID=A0A269Z7B1_9MICO|nr:alpha/beta hydrolase [Brevibacterium casei]PAK93481.1 alpha/beta hydrolase [Brevibacterium casei]